MERNNKSIEAAYTYTGRDINALSEALTLAGYPEADKQRRIISEQVEVVIEAINREENDGQPWIPDYSDPSQLKWEILTWIKKLEGGGFGFGVSGCGYDATCTRGGARLAFISKAAAQFFFENFKELCLKYRVW